MRFLCVLFLVLLTAAVAVFAYYNQEAVTMKFWEWTLAAPLSVVVGATYVLGMVSGWTLIRMVRRSAGSVMDSVGRQFAHKQASA